MVPTTSSGAATMATRGNVRSERALVSTGFLLPPVYALPERLIFRPDPPHEQPAEEDKAEGAGHAGPGDQRHSDQFADDANIVGMPDESIRPLRNQRSARQHEHFVS